ncbi:hypothetical protein ACFQE5_01430 [Pseudonocardia hispaniensis]|uniref:Uncharacterized protein n=1 Tax=Pseudonocardia hispaniensis TaxID=904933 RepID=A0ABW1IWW7_9PSEU
MTSATQHVHGRRCYWDHTRCGWVCQDELAARTGAAAQTAPPQATAPPRAVPPRIPATSSASRA